MPVPALPLLCVWCEWCVIDCEFVCIALETHSAALGTESKHMASIASVTVSSCVVYTG